MTINRTNRPGPRPKTIVGRVLPNEIIFKTQFLLGKYRTIRLQHFSSLYYYWFDVWFDAAALGFDDGLLGFFSQLSGMIEVVQDQDGLWVCTFTDQYKQQQEHQESTQNNSKRSQFSSNLNYDEKYLPTSIAHINKRRKIGGLFNPSNTILWKKFSRLLNINMEDIHIVSSPLQMLHMREPIRASYEINKIRLALSKYPNGISQEKIAKIIGLDKRLFNMDSEAKIIDEYSELFYLVETPGVNEHPIIFDGYNHTLEDLTGQKRTTRLNPDEIAYKFITCGLYQKTLILIRRSDDDGLKNEGLKLCVWVQSILLNFGPANSRREQLLLQQQPIELFLALASMNLVELRSAADCKNDIRVHFPPKKIDFKVFLDQCVERLIAQRAATKSAKSEVAPTDSADRARCKRFLRESSSDIITDMTDDLRSLSTDEGSKDFNCDSSDD